MAEGETKKAAYENKIKKSVREVELVARENIIVEDAIQSQIARVF
jgi:hypothetical protein